MFKNLVSIVCLFILIQNHCFSENKQRMDSLKIELSKNTPDSIKLKIYIKLLEACDLADNFYYGNLLVDFIDKQKMLVDNKARKERMEIIRNQTFMALSVNMNTKKDSAQFIKYFLRKQKKYLLLKDIDGYTETTKIIANQYRKFGHLAKSIAHLKSGIIHTKKNHYTGAEANLHSEFATNLLIIGDTTEAILQLERSIFLYKKLHDSLELANCYIELGSVIGQKSFSLFENRGLNYLKNAEQINRLIKNDFGLFSALNNIAILYGDYKDYNNSLLYYKKTLALAQEKVMPYQIALSNQNIGVSYLEQQQPDSAYFYLFKSKKKAIEIDAKDRIVYANKFLSDVFFMEKKYVESKKYMTEAYGFDKAFGNEETHRYFEKYMCTIDSANNNFKEALFHYQKFIILDKKLNLEELKRTSITHNIQQNYAQQKALDKAAQDKKDALTKSEQHRQKTILLFIVIGLIITIVFAGFIYRSLGIRKKQNSLINKQKKDIENSYQNLELLNKISNEITSSLNLTSVMELIYKNVSALMDVSFFIISTYDSKEDSVDVKFCVKEGEIVPISFKTFLTNPKSVMTALTVRSKKEIIIHDWENEFKLYTKEVAQLKDKNDLYCDSMIWIPLLIKDNVIGLFSVQSIKKHAYSKYDLEMLRSLSSIIAVALNNAEAYNKLDVAKFEITEQKNIVEEKQKEILDSIEYALRIQTAILPPKKIVKQHLENSFILYKPKDIVAGDFYWMETIQLNNVPIKQFDNKNNQLILFAACDCTGHGVPGAMVSVVCHNALNRAVREFGLIEPAAILNKTQEIVLEYFSKSEEDIKDGMDISLCSLNFNKVELQWAGANNPLWLIQKGELLEIKADKQPIGMHEDSTAFTNHIFELYKGDTIYIFSDGFADQFSPADKKLMKKNFKNLLLSIQDKNMEEQHSYLNNFIDNWKGSMEQTDDILVIGVRV